MRSTHQHQLTQEQTDYLFDFCRKHRVRYHDLQVELVDHLASSIEEQWKEKPDLSFEAALDRVYRGFGIRGFAGVVEEKQKAIQRESRRVIKTLMREFLTGPKLLMILLMTVLVRQLLPLAEAGNLAGLLVVIGAYSLLLVLGMIREGVPFIAKKKHRQLFMLEGMTGSGLAVANLVIIFFQLFTVFNVEGGFLAFILRYEVLIWLFAFALVQAGVFLYARLVHVPAHFFDRVAREFPEYI